MRAPCAHPCALRSVACARCMSKNHAPCAALAPGLRALAPATPLALRNMKSAPDTHTGVVPLHPQKCELSAAFCEVDRKSTMPRPTPQPREFEGALPASEGLAARQHRQRRGAEITNHEHLKPDGPGEQSGGMQESRRRDKQGEGEERDGEREGGTVPALLLCRAGTSASREETSRGRIRWENIDYQLFP